MEDLVAPRCVVWCVLWTERGSVVEFVGEVLGGEDLCRLSVLLWYIVVFVEQCERRTYVIWLVCHFCSWKRCFLGFLSQTEGGGYGLEGLYL